MLLVPVGVSVICGQSLPVDRVVLMPNPHKALQLLRMPQEQYRKTHSSVVLLKISAMKFPFHIPLGASPPTSAEFFTFIPPGFPSSGKVQENLPPCVSSLQVYQPPAYEEGQVIAH